jgi:hypothetical protein
MQRKSKAIRRSGRAPWTLALTVLLVGFIAIAAGAVLVVSRTTADAVPIDPTAPGRLVTDQATVDLGRVAFDKLAEARFELANTGGDTVRLVGAPHVRMLEGC